MEAQWSGLCVVVTLQLVAVTSIFGQAVFRRLNEIGLGQKFIDDPNVRTKCYEMTSLAILPPTDILEAFKLHFQRRIALHAPLRGPLQWEGIWVPRLVGFVTDSHQLSGLSREGTVPTRRPRPTPSSALTVVVGVLLSTSNLECASGCQCSSMLEARRSLDCCCLEG